MRVGWMTMFCTAFPFANAIAAESPRTLGIKEVAEIALERAKEARIAEHGVDAAEERVAATRGLLFPRLTASGSLLYWHEPIVAQFPGENPGDPPTLVPIRDQFTAGLTLTAAQPITGLYALFELLGIEKHGLKAAEAEKARADLDSAHRAVEGFIRLLQARAVAEVAAKSVAQVSAQLDRAKSFESAGAMGKVDVLRIESLLEATKQGSVRASAGAKIAEKALLLALDLPFDTPFTPRDDLPDPPPPVGADISNAVVEAKANRPEVIAAEERAKQAALGPKVAIAKLIPNVLAVASYQRSEGQGAFGQKNAFFGGATLQWDIWDWGNAINNADEASARARQAELAAELASDAVGFDAERRLLEARASYEAIGAAKSGLTAAEEAYRIQSARYAQGEATTTDVLDAETDLARARTSFATTRYDYYVSLLALSRALGKPAEVR